MGRPDPAAGVRHRQCDGRIRRHVQRPARALPGIPRHGRGRLHGVDERRLPGQAVDQGARRGRLHQWFQQVRRGNPAQGADRRSRLSYSSLHPVAGRANVPPRPVQIFFAQASSLVRRTVHATGRPVRPGRRRITVAVSGGPVAAARHHPRRPLDPCREGPFRKIRADWAGNLRDSVRRPSGHARPDGGNLGPREFALKRPAVLLQIGNLRCPNASGAKVNKMLTCLEPGSGPNSAR